jgi:anti-sigma regulatory factor (Ser/Thr protein kinase)/ActR/RegA family two-component response regulator
MNSPSHPDASAVPLKRALVVGADPDLAAFLSKVLEPGVWNIQQATNNTAALAAASKEHFDLIITGEKTSGREDLELLRKIRRVRPHTRLIILTGESTPVDVINSMREHAFSYFSKPFSWDDLASMIGHAAEEPCWDDGIEVISATPEWIRTSVRCELKAANRLLQFFNEIADLPDGERHEVAWAFREILMNAIEHGGQLDPTKNVEIDYVRARRMVTCRIADHGPGFSRGEIAHAAVANPADDPIKHMDVRQEQGLRPGGFGILLAQQLVDQLVYNEAGNEVLLVKYLASPASNPS